MKRNLTLIFLLSWICQLCLAQSLTSAEILLRMQRLNVLGTALYFAAHPDDENTKLIAYLASEQKVRTAYLSLTRGDGGQNLIGTELGENLGLIRTNELLQARKTDGGEQYFTSAYDFGFSKTHEETFNFWNKEEVLKESVYLIRKLRPDVIIARFPPDERGGHGHHQASAILAHEAFLAAANPNMFPEQLKQVDAWQAKRLLWNTANFMNMQGESTGQLKINIGQYNPLLGKSYGEISALSRSQHKSQGFGSASSNGDAIESFEHVAGDKATSGLFDHIDLTWNRVNNSASIQTAINRLIHDFQPLAPEQSVKQLASIWIEVQKVEDQYWRERKSKEIEDLILACAGIKIESIVSQVKYVKTQNVNFQTEIIVRNPEIEVNLIKVNNKIVEQKLPTNKIYRHNDILSLDKTTQPYWLEEARSLGKYNVDPKYFGYPLNPDLPATIIDLEVEGVPMRMTRNLMFRYVDPVRGEVHEPIEVAPQITANADKNALLIPAGEAASVELSFHNHSTQALNTEVEVVSKGAGWQVTPKTINLSFKEGETFLSKTVKIKNNAAVELSKITFTEKDKAISSFREITYEHINKQAWFPPLAIKAEPIDLINPVKRIGYLMGAGDLVPESLRLLGMTVDILDMDKISFDLLKEYDAIVFGIRIMNVNKELPNKLPIIYDYIEQGGVVVMQYNVNSGLSKTEFAPLPFTITRARVTEEDAKVNFLIPDDPVLNYPNKITERDFDDWVQERGLYFVESAHPKYRSPLAMHDKNESPHKGSLLISKIGKGKFVYTSLSFFRQLPAGIAGANRLFVNLLANEN